MNISDLVSIAADSTVFTTIDDYTSFCLKYLEFVESGLQAVIVAQNETNYHFYQYKDDGYYNITRLWTSHRQVLPFVNLDKFYSSNYDWTGACFA